MTGYSDPFDFVLLTFVSVNAGMPRMKRIPLLIFFTSTLLVAGCQGGMPQILWPVDDNKPDYARSSRDNPRSEGRVPLDVPPELRKDIEVPMPDKVATEAAQGGARISANEKKAVAGKAVSLDARVYDQSPAVVFSAVIDAMTALNMPVESVDSPSGTITSAWIRFDSSSPNAYVGAAMDMFGAGPTHTRHRFIVRVFRMKDGKTELQIRTLAQQFMQRHWVNKMLKRKAANELFIAVEERIGQQVSSDTEESLPTGNP
ncbi:MAG: hypothetical protein BMS9Abin18_0257 [Zetaproteobacteria bacterium]|nr:MAG: hypothetical protein BMS9Abin18_0257 [Zetaproteobacteria bacterium]